ncbi:unnamed protein product [Pleuronectes platessa]|uniref:Uncharacterized protein n=1 Tax=Pleuronectes platessa TaxID=8262 RepID=A0A9N7YSS6_PLEPL|nr:unnamed protein product [Pleuronectes platessa]
MVFSSVELGSPESLLKSSCEGIEKRLATELILTSVWSQCPPPTARPCLSLPRYHPPVILLAPDRRPGRPCHVKPTYTELPLTSTQCMAFCMTATPMLHRLMYLTCSLLSMDSAAGVAWLARGACPPADPRPSRRSPPSRQNPGSVLC